eukprot:6201063-Pleurochrysis_carterae.AAC.5
MQLLLQHSELRAQLRILTGRRRRSAREALGLLAGTRQSLLRAAHTWPLTDDLTYTSARWGGTFQVNNRSEVQEQFAGTSRPTLQEVWTLDGMGMSLLLTCDT